MSSLEQRVEYLERVVYKLNKELEELRVEANTRRNKLNIVDLRKVDVQECPKNTQYYY